MTQTGSNTLGRAGLIGLVAGAVLFAAGCSSRLSPARLARVFRPAQRQVEPQQQASQPRLAQRPVRAETAVDRAISMQTQGAFDPLRDDARLRSMREAVEASPANLTARLQLAQRYEGYGLADQALEEYMAALSQARTGAGSAEPASTLAAVLSGVARNGLKAGRASEALESLAAVGDLAAGAQFNLQLGLLYDQVGDSDNAEAAYRKAIHLESSLPAARNNLGYRLLRRGQIDEAERHLRAAIDGGSRAARNNLGMLLTQRGDFAAAWEQFSAGSTDAATARNNYAVALMSAGKWMESREQLVLALRERRGFADALRNFKIVQDHIRSTGRIAD